MSEDLREIEKALQARLGQRLATLPLTLSVEHSPSGFMVTCDGERYWIYVSNYIGFYPKQRNEVVRSLLKACEEAAEECGCSPVETDLREAQP